MTELKKISDSKAETTYLVMPEHANPLGNIFGGTIMSWVDITGCMVAYRHCRSAVVTASMDEMHFLYPVHIGDFVTLKAAISYASRRSLEVNVQVFAENPITGEMRKTSTAYITFVAIDESGKAREIPQIVPETEEEKKEFEAGRLRKESRVARAKEMRETK